MIALALQVGVAAILQLGARGPQSPAAAPRPATIVATVIDGDHHVVSGLTANDFDLRDDGQPRAITAAAENTAPLSVTVILDRSDSLSLGPQGVRAAVAQFLTDLQPRDEARVCAFNGAILCSTGFSNDHAVLAQQARRSRSGFGSRLYDALSSTLDEMQALPDDRRRVVVVFSDGEDNGSHTLLRHLMKEARSDGVMVYGVGLETRIDDGDDIVPSRPDLTLMPLARETGGGYYEPERSRDLAGVVTRIEDELQHQYLLTFNAVNTSRPTHHIEVHVTRPHLHVRTREEIRIPAE